MTPDNSGPDPALSEDQTRATATHSGGLVDVTTGPLAPRDLEETGIEPEVLTDLILKLANTVPYFTTDWAVRRLCLPLSLAGQLLQRLVEEKQIEVRGQVGPMNDRYAVTNLGHARAARLIEVSNYVGPAPVPLKEYAEALDHQIAEFPEVTLPDVKRAIADLVISDEAAEIAGLAVSSGRSLFVYGPPGNGKTSLGHMLHRALEGHLWIPYCLGIGSHMIRLFDPQTHERVTEDQFSGDTRKLDQRWVCIRRPFIVAGGELTLDALDLVHGFSRGSYEAPLHVKANGGIFLLDDFGCQRAEPHEMINRWIIPLEHEIDYLTLQTGQQIEVPFRQLLIVSTNIDPEQVMTPGLLRRVGYRLYLADPSAEQYTRIFRSYAAKCGLDVPEGLVDWLIDKYRRQGRPFRACESRDLIERSRDICRYREQVEVLNTQVLDLAWKGYFSNKDAVE